MTTLLVAKQYIKHFISKYEVYLKPLLKLILALTSLMLINGKIGYMHRLDSISIVLIAALMCSFMPMNFIIVVAAVFTVLHMYALSLECAVVTLVLFLVLFLLYFRFSPKDTIVVLLTPMSFILGIPYVMPLAMGLLGSPASAVSVGCGVIVTFFIRNIADGSSTLSAMETEDMASRFRYIIDGFISNKGMILTIVAFTATIIIVYLIRRLSVDYAWIIAIVVGTVAQLLVIFVGDFVFGVSVSAGALIFGLLLSIVLAMIYNFFFFSVDYTRTEYVQFEDDDYYYYVKAVPKMTVSSTDVKVQRISARKRSARVKENN